METWGIYIRVSTRHQAEEGFSLADQRERLLDYANARGWDTVVYEDAGRSGETLSGRPQMVALLDAVERGELSGVLVTDESRLSRSNYVMAQIRERLHKTGTRLATPARGVVDLSEPTDSLITTVLGAVHAFEQDVRTEKMKIGHRRAAEAGFWRGGEAPYGFRTVQAPDGSKHKVLAINEEEADTLRAAVRFVLDEGHSTYATTQRLNALGYVTRSGRRWGYRNLQWQLRKPSLAGTWTLNAETGPISIEVPAIITQERWDALQAALDRRTSGRPSQRHTYPLTGHLWCRCGIGLSGVYRSDRQTRYMRCGNTESDPKEKRCPHMPRSYRAGRLEQALWDEISRALNDPDYLLHLATIHRAHLRATTPGQEQIDEESRALRARLDTLNRKMERVAVDLELATDVAQRIVDDLTRERNIIQHRLSALATQPDISALNQADLAQTAKLIAARVTEATPKLMKETFDLLDLQATVRGVHNGRVQLKGTAALPHGSAFDGKVPAGMPHRL